MRKRTFLRICAQRRLKSVFVSAQSCQSLRCLHGETLHHWPSKMHPRKIMIRLRECTGWSESSHCAHIQDTFSDIASHFISNELFIQSSLLSLKIIVKIQWFTSLAESGRKKKKNISPRGTSNVHPYHMFLRRNEINCWKMPFLRNSMLTSSLCNVYILVPPLPTPAPTPSI